MPFDFSKEFPTTPLDLEIDLKEQGGIQRFKFVSDLSRWIQEETDFWQWMKTGSIPEFSRKALGGRYETFFEPINNAAQRIVWLNGQYTNLKQQYEAAETEKNEEGKKQKQDDAQVRYEQAIKDASDQTRSFLVGGIVNQKTHMFRGMPQAAFVHQISEDDPATACFVLAQFMQDELGGDSSAYETKGRTLALLFSKGWMPRKEAEKLAYSGALNTWKTELGHFKNDYTEQLSEFQNVKGDISNALTAWEATAQDLQSKFQDQFKANDLDLKNLKETYEGFMHLNGPMTYWQGKRREHDAAIKVWARWCTYAAILGVCGLILAGNNLLPDVTISNVIPWKKLGAFIMVATVVIWLMRFPFKMLLSHIHLRGDAKEREVMISTYMALLRGADGEKGISKENLQMVLTPIFRPATSGIIKDDGGPVSFFEMITRMK